MRRSFLLGSGIVSSALYVATDVLGSIRYPGYSYKDQWFSELTAEGAPVRSFMVALNVIPYTALVSALALGVWSLPNQSRKARLTAASLAGFAAFGIAGGLAFPMKPREALIASEGTLRNTLHIPSTALMSLSLLFAMGFGATLLGRRFRTYWYGTILTVLVFGVLTSLQAGKVEANEPSPWAGIEERVNIYATMLWIAILAVGLLRADHAEAPGTIRRQATPQLRMRGAAR